MIFVDVAKVIASAGDGGRGMTSFRREPYVDRGGPDGGDGGQGGNVVFRAEQNLNSLSAFRHKQKLAAEDGGNGARAKRHGKNGDNLVIKVPVGTVISNSKEQLADLSESGDEVVLAKGGDGGFGNAHFTSSTRQAPNFAENGEPGEEYELSLELKMIADVGLVGLPNAGKSTFLSVVSNARPQIADYPFTTLAPNLGVADVGEYSLLIADIPGLIEGASEGKGLGDDFLRHVERTAVLIHLIDVYSNDIAADYQTIVNELKSYKVDLTTRDIVIALTKTENIDEDIVNDQLEKLQAVSGDLPVQVISSVAKKGTQSLLKTVYKMVEDYREKEAKKQATDGTKKITLDQANEAWKVDEKDERVIITGSKIEKFARRTDFENTQAIGRLRDIMQKMGIERELKRRKVDPGTQIQIGRSGEFRFKF